MRRILVVLIVITMGNSCHAKGFLSLINGTDASVQFNNLEIDVNDVFEINFSGFTSNRHSSNVMFYQSKNGKEVRNSVTPNYSGRLKEIIMNNGNFSFLLLKADFKDSGYYTVVQKSIEKGNTTVLVTHRILLARLGERFTLSFNVPERNTSAIRINRTSVKTNLIFLHYNVSKEVCDPTNDAIIGDTEVQECVFNTGRFEFTIANISWLHKAGYYAWDETGYLLDSIFVEINENSISDRFMARNETGTGLLISALFIGLLSAFIVTIAVRKRKTCRSLLESGMVKSTTGQKLAYKEANLVPANSSQNGCQKLEANIKMNDRNLYSKDAITSVKMACKLQKKSNISLSETVPEDPSGHEYEELNSACLLDCNSTESWKCLKPLSTADTSKEYNYVMNHTFMTLRPPAMDPIVSVEKAQQNGIGKFLHSFKNKSIDLLSRARRSTLYVTLATKRAKYSRDIFFSVEQNEQTSIGSTDELTQPCLVELGNDSPQETIELPNVSTKEEECEKKCTEMCIESRAFIYNPQSSHVDDSDPRTVSRHSSYDYLRSSFNTVSGNKMVHQRSRSYNDLSWDLLKPTLERRGSVPENKMLS